MNFQFDMFHAGHNLVLANHEGKLMVVCMTCQVAGELEAISKKISVEDAYKTGKVERIAIGDVSKGVPLS